MAKYQVLFARYGWVTIEADSEQDAYQKVEGYGKEDIEWSNGRMILKQRIVMSWTNGVIENEYVLLDDRGNRSLRKQP